MSSTLPVVAQGPRSAGLRARRPDPGLVRALRHGLVVAGLLFAAYLFLFSAPSVGTFGYDAYAYWSVDAADPYRVAHGQFSSFVYAPALAQVFSLVGVVPWWVFSWLWTALLVATVIWLGGRSTLALLALPPVAVELYYGNIHLLLAAAIVLGFRYPWTWSFVLLSKVTPGIGLAWFAARREWRSLLICAAATAAIACISIVIAPEAWLAWVRALVADAGSGTPNGGVPVPLWARLPAAFALVWWGGRTGRRWTVPVGALLALPVIWLTSFSLLVALGPLTRWDRRAGRPAAVATVPPPTR